MVAHAGQGARRRRVGGGADIVHQAGARPPRGAVETGLARLLALLAIGGQRGVDQPGVEVRKVFPADAGPGAEIGRASRRERGWKYVYISVVAVSFKKKTKTQ